MARALWVSLGVMLFVLAVTYLLPLTLEKRVRFGGLVLELAGISVVVFGLNEKLRLFNRPTLIGQLGSWLAGYPSFKPRHHVLEAAGAAIGIAGCRASLSVWSNPANQSSEARLDALERNVTRLREDQERISKQFQDETRKCELAISEERRARTEVDKELRSLIEAFGVGGAHLEAIGVSWLLVGATLATISEEISSGVLALLTLGR
jgi:outer membrane murein-binding lipoprotein Lpp